MQVGHLSRLGEEHSVPVVMDDTVGFGNFPGCGVGQNGPDIVVSSLSKVFNGTGNAMGGSMVLNRDRPMYNELKQLMEAQYECTLYREDAEQLIQNSSNVVARCRSVRENAAVLVDFLRTHPVSGQVLAKIALYSF